MSKRLSPLPNKNYNDDLTINIQNKDDLSPYTIIPDDIVDKKPRLSNSNFCNNDHDQDQKNIHYQTPMKR